MIKYAMEKHITNSCNFTPRSKYPSLVPNTALLRSPVTPSVPQMINKLKFHHWKLKEVLKVSAII